MQGLDRNRYQFALLVLVNAFVGAMVGLERSIIPNFGKVEFGINANTALMSFIIAFGLSKSLSNYAVAQLSKRYSRKAILVAGWIAALPIPYLLMYAPDWNWVIAANILLGLNQGLAWSATVIMKIDLVGSKDRGLAMGINEFAGYLSVGLAAWLASSIAMDYGYAYFPYIPGILFSVIGLLITIFLVKDTSHFVQAEGLSSDIPLLGNVWKETSWKHRNLGSVSLNGLVNNLNDGVVWGLMPVLLIQKGFDITQIGIIAGIYPAVWGVTQLITGKLGDNYCKKQIISSGMFLQALAIIVMAIAGSMPLFILASVLLGLGTALVYPNFLSVIAEWTHPSQRAESLSIFRLWRDSGYVFGAVLSGILADWFGIGNALFIVALITALSGLIANQRMCCSNRLFWKSELCVPQY